MCERIQCRQQRMRKRHKKFLRFFTMDGGLLKYVVILFQWRNIGCGQNEKKKYGSQFLCFFLFISAKNLIMRRLLFFICHWFSLLTSGVCMLFIDAEHRMLEIRTNSTPSWRDVNELSQNLNIFWDFPLNYNLTWHPPFKINFPTCSIENKFKNLQNFENSASLWCGSFQFVGKFTLMPAGRLCKPNE